MSASARDSRVIELVHEEIAHNFQRQTCRPEPPGVDYEPVRHSHPHIKSSTNTGTDGPFEKTQGVVEEDLVVAHLNAYGGQTNQRAVEWRGQGVMRLGLPQVRVNKLHDLG